MGKRFKCAGASQPAPRRPPPPGPPAAARQQGAASQPAAGGGGAHAALGAPSEAGGAAAALAPARNGGGPQVQTPMRWALLQALMAEGCMKEERCKGILRRLTGANDGGWV
jgi:hypothetical protein